MLERDYTGDGSRGGGEGSEAIEIVEVVIAAVRGAELQIIAAGAKNDAVVEGKEAGLDILGFLQFSGRGGVKAGPAKELVLVTGE